MSKLTHLSLFSGIGGLDLAAEWAGFETVGQCEFADYPTKILKKHWPDVPRWKDVRTLTKEGFYERTGLRTVDVISGGFPCQPFSGVGKKQGRGDERYLFPEMLRVVGELAPTWVVGENVTGIDDGNLDWILKDLEKEDYEITGVYEVPASLFGAPHERYRTTIVAHVKSKPGIQADSPIVPTGIQREAWRGTLREAGATISRTYWSIHKSPVPGMDDGLPTGMDIHRSRCMTLGNAVVPQQFAPIFTAIAEIERARDEATHDSSRIQHSAR